PKPSLAMTLIHGTGGSAGRPAGPATRITYSRPSGVKPPVPLSKSSASPLAPWGEGAGGGGDGVPSSENRVPGGPSPSLRGPRPVTFVSGARHLVLGTRYSAPRSAGANGEARRQRQRALAAFHLRRQRAAAAGQDDARRGQQQHLVVVADVHRLAHEDAAGLIDQAVRVAGPHQVLDLLLHLLQIAGRV